MENADGSANFVSRLLFLYDIPSVVCVLNRESVPGDIYLAQGLYACTDVAKS